MNSQNMSRRSFLKIASMCAAATVGASIASGYVGPSIRKAFASRLDDLSIRPTIFSYSIDDEKRVRELGLVADLSALPAGEYPALCFDISNPTTGAFNYDEMCVTVDGNGPWHWKAGSIESGKSHLYHVYYVNMQHLLSEGVHIACLYANGQLASIAEFTLVRAQDWGSVYSLPTRAQIDEVNAAAAERSPYASGFPRVPYDGFRFTRYSIDFKSDSAPVGSYFCLLQWAADLDGLRARYPDAHVDDVCGGYAGLQNTDEGWHSIMSCWNVYYTDESGQQRTVSPKVVYPASAQLDFDGEGTGRQCILDYPWQAGRWYRMIVDCHPSETGTTLVEQWFCDLQSGEWTHQCTYDLGLEGVALRESICFFNENYKKSTSGEVRCMEVMNIAAVDAQTGEVVHLDKAWLQLHRSSRHDFYGSYAFGATANRFWSVASGVGGGGIGNPLGTPNGIFTVSR